MWMYLGIGLRGMNEIFYKMKQHRHQQQVFEPCSTEGKAQNLQDPKAGEKNREYPER